MGAAVRKPASQWSSTWCAAARYRCLLLHGAGTSLASGCCRSSSSAALGLRRSLRSSRRVGLERYPGGTFPFGHRGDARFISSVVVVLGRKPDGSSEFVQLCHCTWVPVLISPVCQ